jgi:hypothetical protein
MSRRYGGNLGATIVLVVADVAALILGVWILMYILDANRANDLVNWVHNTANWLATWSRDIFTVQTGWLRTLLNYGLPAVVYLLVGHALAGRINRV